MRPSLGCHWRWGQPLVHAGRRSGRRWICPIHPALPALSWRRNHWGMGAGWDLSLPDDLRNREIAEAGFRPSYVLWHQGEADALYGTSANDYANAFRALVQSFRDLDIRAPIYVATASYFAVPEGYGASQAIIRHAQQLLISPEDLILPGPDTDLIRDRFDGCHMGNTGLREHAQMWQTCLRGTRRRWDATVPVPRSPSDAAKSGSSRPIFDPAGQLGSAPTTRK